jgi:hypothetical protein
MDRKLSLGAWSENDSEENSYYDQDLFTNQMKSGDNIL